MTRKQIHSKFPGTCVECKKRFPAGSEVYWASGAGSICRACWDKGVVDAANAGDPMAVIEMSLLALEDEDAEYRAERERINDIARRYGPAGKFNRRLAEERALAAARARKAGTAGR